MEFMQKVSHFEQMKMSGMSTSDRVRISREMKSLILEINEVYKSQKDDKLMEIMKNLTVIKRKVEKRLKFNPQL